MANIPRILAYDKPLIQLHTAFKKHQPAAAAQVWVRQSGGIGDLCQCSCGIWMFRYTDQSKSWRAMHGYLTARALAARHPSAAASFKAYYQEILPTLPPELYGFEEPSTYADFLGQ
jgi:hypothetical protein